MFVGRASKLLVSILLAAFVMVSLLLSEAASRINEATALKGFGVYASLTRIIHEGAVRVA